MRQDRSYTRRAWMAAAGATTATLGGQAWAADAKSAKKGNTQQDPEVTATEDLMREHGVIRRALLVYQECSG